MIVVRPSLQESPYEVLDFVSACNVLQRESQLLRSPETGSIREQMLLHGGKVLFAVKDRFIQAGMFEHYCQFFIRRDLFSLSGPIEQPGVAEYRTAKHDAVDACLFHNLFAML